ncbi:MAG: hypothetical protein GTN45_10970 [Xanthomonadales bacterium]|nr:hypothetical protein [Xanthomonadales bacterium]
MIKSRALLSLSVVMMLVACSAQRVAVSAEAEDPLPRNTLLGSATVHKPEVILVITGKGSKRELLIIAGPGNCQTSTHPGCVRVPQDDKAEINFRMYGIPDWEMTSIQLVSEAHSSKLDFAAQTGFTEAMKDDFYVQIGGAMVKPDDNGIIDLSSLADGTEFTLHDLNNFQQSYRYQIRACKNTQCVESDPMIENEG